MSTFAFVGAATPGPVNVIAAFAGATKGFRLAIPYVLGASISYTIVILLSGLGLEQALKKLPFLSSTLRYIGAGYLLYMSYKIFTSPINNESSANTSSAVYKPTWQKGFLTQWLNPKAWLFAMTGISLFVSPHNPYTVYFLSFAMISFIICFIGVGFWAGLGQFLQKWLHKENHQRWFNRIMGLLLASTTLSLGWF